LLYLHRLVTFLLAQKSNQSRSRKLTGREPNASACKPTRPSLGKEAYALFYWLVLRTAPHVLTTNNLKLNNRVIHYTPASSILLGAILKQAFSLR